MHCIMIGQNIIVIKLKNEIIQIAQNFDGHNINLNIYFVGKMAA